MLNQEDVPQQLSSVVEACWRPFLESRRNFLTRKAITKAQTLKVTELFYILNMNRGSLQTKSFRRRYFSILRYRWIESDFTGQKCSRGFRETDPRTHNPEVLASKHHPARLFFNTYVY